MKRDVDDDDDDGDNLARDGSRLRVPLMLCDGFAFDAANHQPGFVRVTDNKEVRDARKVARDARTEMIRQLGDAWRKLPLATSATAAARDAPEPDTAVALLRGGSEKPDDAQARRDAVYRRYRDDLSNAWRHCGSSACYQPAPNAAVASGSAGVIERNRRRFTAES
jgi:alpha-beta hydrolase superfamily lysophospholipase